MQGPLGRDEQQQLRTRYQELVGEGYELQELAGCGAASCVFRARDTARGDEVALKVLQLPSSSADATFAALEQHTSAVAKLTDARIVAPRAVVRRGESALIAMPFVRGRSLRDVITDGGAMAFDAVSSILLDVAEALDHAHAAGVVHGGLRPSDVLVDGRGRAYVTDFAIASAFPPSRSGLGAAAMERAAYMAPEQLHGGEVDGRTDQFSLAVIAHEMLSGHSRTSSWTPSALATLEPVEIASDAPIHSGVPLSANIALRQALSRQPSHRFPTTRIFAEGLAGRRAVTPQGMPTMHPLLELPHKRGRMFPVLAVLLLLAIGVALFGPWRIQEGPLTRAARIRGEKAAERRAAEANRTGAPGGGGGGGGGGSGGTTTPLAGGAAGAEEASFIQVTAGRPGAVVFVDGTPRGVVPATVRVSPGEHTVTLRGGGYAGASRTVATSAGATARVDFGAAATPAPK